MSEINSKAQVTKVKEFFLETTLSTPSISIAMPSLSFKKGRDLICELYVHVVRSVALAFFATYVLGGGIYLIQKHIFRIDTTFEEALRFFKLMGSYFFVDQVFQFLEEKLVNPKEHTYESLRPTDKSDWHHQVFRVKCAVLTFFPKIYLTFRLAKRIGCLTVSAGSRRMFYGFVFCQFLNLVNDGLLCYINRTKPKELEIHWKLRLSRKG